MVRNRVWPDFRFECTLIPIIGIVIVALGCGKYSALAENFLLKMSLGRSNFVFQVSK